ncbi:MAG: GDSL-type esterase/lipase family protein, partial [Gemmatimonadaceae bacterium]
STQANSGILLRGQSGDFYFGHLDFASPALHIYKVVGGAVTSLVGPTTVTVVFGDSYTLDFYVDGTSPTNFSLSATNVTTSTVIGTITGSDSDAALQTAGVPGIVTWAPSASAVTINYSQATTYTGTPGSGSITISPTSVVGGTTGNVITVTGTGTTFSGSPFTVSGGLGPLITAQSVSSTTAGTLTINPGVQGYGTITIDDAADSATATLTVTTPPLGALNIGWIGDSITAGTNGAPVTAAASTLTGMGYTVTTTNEAVSGTTTADWLPGGSYLPGALTAFATAGVTVVHIMLGTNDVRQPNNFTPAQHHSNMRAIVLALVAAGYQVVITKPIYTVPNSGSSGAYWPNDPNTPYLEYFTLNMQLVDGIRIFQGDTGGYEISSLNPTTFLATPTVGVGPGVHPQDATQNNILGSYWATAIVERFGNSLTPFIAQTINRHYNSDGES